MESSFIELKVISCKDLKAFNFFQKLSVYALVSIATDDDKKGDQKQQQQRTPTDREGDGNPEWNHTVRFEVSNNLFQDCENVFIHFDLRHEGVMFGDKTIGQVHVRFKDLILESNGVVRFVTYEVRTTDGKSNGVLNFSFKVKLNGSSKGSSNPITGYPVFHHHHHHQSPDQTQFCFSEPKVHYPFLELENIFQGPHELRPSSPATQDPFQETYYSPHNDYNYEILPPPPPPPPAAMAYGPCYHPPPPGPSPWRPSPYVGAHGYSTRWSQRGSADGPLEETRPNGWHVAQNHHSSYSYKNGR